MRPVQCEKPLGRRFDRDMERGQRLGKIMSRHISIEAYLMLRCVGRPEGGGFWTTHMWILLHRPGPTFGEVRMGVWRAFYRKNPGYMRTSEIPEILAMAEEFDAENASEAAAEAIERVLGVD